MKERAYQVHLPVFEGPLDLLLHLIEQEELDITTVSLAQVTDQYLSYLALVQEIRPDDLVDFLSVAARLLLIKSRALLPQSPRMTEEEEDTGEDLVQQLREYRQFKQVAQVLQQRNEQGLHMYPRTAPTPELLEAWTPALDLEDTSLDDLISALRGMLRDQLASDGELTVVLHEVTIDDKIARISALIERPQQLFFDDVLEDARSKVEIIVTLLAVLELIRARRISVQQETLFGRILILPLELDTLPENTQGTLAEIPTVDDAS